MKLKNLQSWLTLVVRSQLYRFGANGDNRLMAALCIFCSISKYLDLGNYTLRQSKKSYHALKSDNSELLQLLDIQQALLYYSSCFDSIMQFVFFAFHFAPKFKTEEEFKDTLKNFRWCKIENKLTKYSDGSDHKRLLNLLQNSYKQDDEFWECINSLKHRGGISIPSLNTYVPDIANCSGMTYSKDGSQYSFNIPDDFYIVKAQWFYPLTKTISQYQSILENANNHICDFVDDLFDLMNINEQALSDTKFTLPFYIDNGTEQNK